MKRSNKGFSLIELVVSVAIFSLVAFAICSTMVVASRNYTRGSVNVELQQEAQITSNLLTNFVIDSANVAVVGLDPSGASDGGITITSTDGSVTTISFNSSAKELQYSKAMLDGSVESGTLASGVSAFYADDSEYAETKNVYFSLGLLSFDEVSDFKTSFSVTSRNEAIKTEMKSTAVILTKTAVIIEPNQELQMECRVLESSAGFRVANLTGNTSTSSSVVADNVNNKVIIKAGGDESASEFYFDIVSNETMLDADGNPTSLPVDTRKVRVAVRRITGITVSPETTINGRAGDVYSMRVKITGTNLKRQDFAFGDEAYVNPCYIQFRVNEASGKSNIGGWGPEGATSMRYFNKLFEGVAYNDYDQQTPDCVEFSYKFKCKFDLDSYYPLFFTIKATAAHSYGHDLYGALSNKTGISYNQLGTSHEVYGETLFTLKLPLDEPGPIESPTGLLRAGDTSVFNTPYYARSRMGVPSSVDWNNVHTYFRYREVLADGSFGPWSEYRMSADRSTLASGNTKLNAGETMLFDPNKQYQLEMIWGCQDGSGKVTWPNYGPLVAQYGSNLAVGAEAEVTEVTKIGSRFGVNAVAPVNPVYNPVTGELKADRMEAVCQNIQFKVTLQKWNGSDWENKYTNGDVKDFGGGVNTWIQPPTESGKYRLKYETANTGTLPAWAHYSDEFMK